MRFEQVLTEIFLAHEGEIHKRTYASLAAVVLPVMELLFQKASRQYRNSVRSCTQMLEANAGSSGPG